MKKTSNAIYVLEGKETVTEKLQLLVDLFGELYEWNFLAEFIKDGLFKEEVNQAMEKCTMIAVANNYTNFGDSL